MKEYKFQGKKNIFVQKLKQYANRFNIGSGTNYKMVKKISNSILQDPTYLNREKISVIRSTPNKQITTKKFYKKANFYLEVFY